MPSQTATLLQHAIRVPDPYFQVHDQWLIRQLAPDIAKIDMPRERDKRLGLAPDLLRLMGRETANIHLGSRTSEDLTDRLSRLDRNRKWFPAATDRMVACTRKDHAKWAEAGFVSGAAVLEDVQRHRLREEPDSRPLRGLVRHLGAQPVGRRLLRPDGLMTPVGWLSFARVLVAPPDPRNRDRRISAIDESARDRGTGRRKTTAAVAPRIKIRAWPECQKG